jgi:pimeloyl-ACP methyl ester carboxylesterase
MPTIEKLIAIDGIEVWAERTTQGGEPVLLLTGATLQAIAWEPVFTDVLEDAGFDLVRFDWRDVGKTTWRRFKEQPYTAESLVDDAARVLDAFGISKAHVVGFSMGGIMGQLLAVRHPERVRSLTTMASGFASARGNDFRNGERRSKLFEVLSLPRPESSTQGVQRLVEQWRHLCGRAWRFDESEWSARARGWVERGHNWSCPHLRLWAGVASEDREEAFRASPLPVLVIHGTDEAMFPLPHGEAIAAAFPNADMVRLEDRGHDIHLDGDVARLVADFVGTTGRAR